MPDKKSVNPSLSKAYQMASRRQDDEGVPYADASGKQDTGTYLVPVDSGGGSWVTDWFEKFTNRPDYQDGSWLPEGDEIVIIPREVIENIVIPDTHTTRPGPDFTPEGEGRIPGVIVEPDKRPRKPRKTDSYYDSMRPVRIKPTVPKTL